MKQRTPPETLAPIVRDIETRRGVTLAR